MKDAKKRIAGFVNIDFSTGCWNWGGCVQSNGYGRVTYKRKTMGAHRLSYMAFVGEIPSGFDVCHKCDNRKCVNPLHLFVGSRLDNMKDAVSKGRQAKGKMLPITKIHGEALERVLEMIKEGITYSKIADKFNVCRHTIGHIARKNGVYRNAK